MKKFNLIFCVILFTAGVLFAQSDVGPETKFNQSALRKVSGDEKQLSTVSTESQVPAELFKKYNSAVDTRNENLKEYYGAMIESYLNKPKNEKIPSDMGIMKEQLFMSDWYSSDIMITTTEVAYAGSYRQLDLKQGEDGMMYLAVNRRNVTNYSGFVSVYSSSNGGATWSGIASAYTASGYFASVSMLVESRDNAVGDSTRLMLFYTYSPNTNFDNASLYCASFRRDGSAAYVTHVASPTAGNRFVYPSACSDGMFYSSATYMHAIVREETNAGAFVGLQHFRTINWGSSFTSAAINTFSDDRYPVCAYSNENGTDSIYIAVERVVSPSEHEIRLVATSETPTSSHTIRYITDAANGTLYERPAIAIQQRTYSLPQRILVTCTKNNRAVYHYSNDGGAVWDIDFNLGNSNQQVDYTSCNTDSLTAGGKDFIAAFVDLNGDSITVRNGELGAMGSFNYKRNSVQSTGSLAPTCAIYKTGIIKNAAIAYSGLGPASVYYNMETLLTGVNPVNGEVPESFKLGQNYPNPFNPVTNIKFSVPKAGNVSLKVYDISGKLAAELVNSFMNAGVYDYDFDASGLSSGIYIYRIAADGFTDAKKMILVK